MKSSLLKILTATGLFLLSGVSLQAQIDSILTLDLRCYYQAKFTSSAARDTGKVPVVRLDSKQLISLLAKQVGVRFPGGSLLKIAPDGSVFVANSKGQPLGDVSRFFKAKVDHKNSLFHGTRNNVNLREVGRYYYPLTLTIDLPDLQFTVSGIVNETYKVSGENQLGVQITHSVGFSEINGKGTVDGKPAYFIGDLKLRGKEADIIN